VNNRSASPSPRRGAAHGVGRKDKAQTSGIGTYRADAERLVAAYRGAAWNRLAEMTDTFGHRPSGSAAPEGALRWADAGMKEDGLENVRLERVKVPHWVRGQRVGAGGARPHEDPRDAGPR
jgi:hypothetical protein